MSDSENYLDQLLNSVNGGGASAPSGRAPEKRKTESPKDSSMDSEFPDEDFLAAFDDSMSDEDFLASFEKDLGISDSEDAEDDLPSEVAVKAKDKGRKAKKDKKDKASKRRKKQPLSLMEEIDDSLLSARGEDPFGGTAFDDEAFDLQSADEVKGEDISDEDLLPDTKPTEDELSFANEEAKSTEADASVASTSQPEEISSESPAESLTDGPEELPLTEAGEPDLAGVDNDDLLNMLSETEGMEDIGDLLQKDEAGENVSSTDEIGKFADAEMNGSGGTSESEAEASEDEDEEEESKNPFKKLKKKKDKKKASKKKAKKSDSEDDSDEEDKEPGFFGKLFKKLTVDPEEEEEEKLDISPVEGSGVEELSDENMQLLRELEDADTKPAQEKPEEKKKKEKKKKEKPKKEKKPPKPKKPKKEKKPKEPDNSPKLNKKGVAVLFLLVASLFAAVIFLNNVGNYSMAMSSAKADYRKQLYIDAYMEVEGITIKEKDTDFYNRVCTMATVYEQYHNYLVFKNQDMTVRAFDSLVCAAGRYHANLDAANEYGCLDEMNNLGLDIQTALSDNYGMTMDDAQAIYSEKTRAKYTIALYQKLMELGLE